MNRRIAATIELQSPSYTALWRQPSAWVVVDVCPACKRPTTRHRFSADGHPVETHHCPEHGDVSPMRSHVANAEPVR